MNLLQIATGITKCDDYYKLRQLLQSAMNLLQIATVITKCDDYYKLRQVLQSAMIITNCDSTAVSGSLYFRLTCFGYVATN